MASYSERLTARVSQLNTPALVGLDPRWDQLPADVREAAQSAGGNAAAVMARGFESFCCEIVDIVAPLVPAVKPQIAFFEQLGPQGFTALARVISHARAAGLIVIADAKRGDIGSTATAYADAWLAGEDSTAAPFGADALTVNAYLGDDTLRPFVEKSVSNRAGLYILVRTSNPGAATFQDRISENHKLFETVADVVQLLNSSHWPDDTYGSIGAVVGATWPKELMSLRARMPNTPFLVPGYGSQGGTAADVAGAFDLNGHGALVNSSRAINFAFQKQEYAEQFGPAGWRDSIQAATRQMIEDLQMHIPTTA
ncbi:MAG: orotidine-5'-phosphate decarboxylase [Fuerstiella sp.]|jgi:orotidine-5'-phosphate decarboxylase|nr:orotidine-5'-phosphate decarboxylase [Fuerstiella sp.]